RVMNGPELVEILSARIATRPTAAWVELFNRHGVVFGEILDYASAVASEQFAARKLTMTVSDDEHEFTTVRGPARYSSFTAASTNAAPRVGQHNDEIRAQYGAGPSPA
ncbi:MAG: CoA transferase, partial [Antricoccus sp.]